MNLQNKSRNNTVDILRGLAMLMVIMGHTMTGCTINSESSFLFNVIWVIQMPLFMLISGYVTKYSKVVDTGIGLWRYIIKKTLAYLFPWLVWTFLIRGLIFGRTFMLDIKYLMYHMDSGYWFLFALWTISIVFGISQFIAEKMSKNKGNLFKYMILGCAYLTGLGVLIVIGTIFGMSFLCIKLTLYYMPFYFAGALYGGMESFLQKIKSWIWIKECTVAISFVVWIILLNNFTFFDMGEGILDIVIRAMASLLGCISIFGLLSNVAWESKEKFSSVKRFFNFVGFHSLEIYLLHYLVLTIVKVMPLPEFATVAGWGIVVLNFVITVGLTCFTAYLLNKNKVLRGALFGKFQ